MTQTAIAPSRIVVADSMESQGRVLETQAGSSRDVLQQFAMRAQALEHRRRALQMRGTSEKDIAAAIPSGLRSAIRGE